MSKTLTEVLPELSRPFTAAAIKMKPQATTGEGESMKGLVTYYVDSRLVVERLNSVVGPEGWSDSYRLLVEGALAPGVGIPVECSLMVLGYTKVDVGQIAPGVADDKAWKSAYSDAFKRAAVKFRIGAYLYGGAGVWAPVKVGRNGKAQGFTPDGAAQARRSYESWIASKAMKDIYGEPLDHGDVLAEDLSGSDGASGDGAANASPASGSTPQQPAPSVTPSEAEPRAAEAGPANDAVSQADPVAVEPASASDEPFPIPPGILAQLPVEEGRTAPDTGLPQDVRVHFGKNAGKSLGELTKRSVEWYASNELRPGASAEDRRLKAAAQTLLELGDAA